ncbi:unnamed protein product [Periconia digitata]|uniref:Uncharacterized protein n=1 Tax=Periconia digitata TaxID=1303443 RepID=A0A9W4URQ2_9PLEO|nr:unnamed protein product [Periconia digitata]
MDSTGSQDSGRGPSRRSGKKPMQFMFIDSTSHGVNAKPDKAVRSFVMKSARSKKPWSTRQKSPKTDADPDADSPPLDKPNTPTLHIQPGYISPGNSAYSSDSTAPSPGPLSAQSYYSPVDISRHASFSYAAASSFNPSQPYTNSPASPRLVCNISHCTGEYCGHIHDDPYTALTTRTNLTLKSANTFDCFPIPTNERVRGLIDNFVKTFAGGLIPLDHRQVSKASTTKWISNSMLSHTGAPFIFAVLYSSVLTSLAKPDEILLYKTRAVGAINAQLKDLTSRVDDNNIAAVFMLLTLEEMTVVDDKNQSTVDQSKKERDVHRDGLKEMIQQRGGLASLASNPNLQIFILMHSMAHAVSTFERPYATLVDTNGQPIPYDMPSFRSRPYSTRNHRLFQMLHLDSNLLEIIANVIVFVGDLSVWFDDPRTPLNPFELQKNNLLLVYQLFDWYKLGEEHADITRSPVDQSICLSLIIFLIALQEVRSYHMMVQIAAQKLKSALEKCVFQWGQSTDVLMWALTLGAMATQGTESFAFFKHHCRIVYANQGIHELTTTHELLDRMRQCLWIGGNAVGGEVSYNLDEELRKLWILLGYTKEEIAETVEDQVYSPDSLDNEDVVGGLTIERFYRKSEAR